MATKNEASRYRLPTKEFYHLNKNIHNPIIPHYREIEQGGKQNEAGIYM